MNTLRWPLAVLLAGLTWCPARAATVAETQAFLRDHHHAWLPYPWPFETSTNELARLLKYDFDTVGLSFAGSYHGGDIDFSALDMAIGMVAAKHKTVVLNLTPRFDPSDGVFDRLSDGSFVTNEPEKNPNAVMIDIFDPIQRENYCRWIELCMRRYGADRRVSAFVIGWGYMGETGFYIGDFLQDYSKLGSVASGYSDWALKEFNRWRRKKHLPALAQLPTPSLEGMNGNYLSFHRFRAEFAGGVFQKEAVARAKALTRKPVGIFGYISVNGNNYGRDWAATPNADFYRSAVSTASYDLHRTLLDAGMGWEDGELADGRWNYSVAGVERNLARQFAHGAVAHAMPVRDYAQSPPWETNFFPRIAEFILTNRVAEHIRATPVEVALFQPTWSYAALPAQSPRNLFVPRATVAARCAKMIGLAESFGLPYRLITERDLLSAGTLRSYRHIIVPMWDLMPMVLGQKAFDRLAQDPRIIPIPTGTAPLARSEFRQLLERHGVGIPFDFDGERILAGRVNNLIFNWTDSLLPVRLGEGGANLVLQPMEFRYCNSIR